LKLTAASQKLLDQYQYTYQGEESSPKVCVCGKVAAGIPIEAIEDKRFIGLPGFDGQNIFELEVSGDSMIEEGIFDGDYVICSKKQTADNGQLVVAIIDENEATLKRFYKEKNVIRLQPANSNYKPIYTKNCRIEAVVVGLVRKVV
jgi:repressor LexA